MVYFGRLEHLFVIVMDSRRHSIIDDGPFDDVTNSRKFGQHMSILLPSYYFYLF